VLRGISTDRAGAVSTAGFGDASALLERAADIDALEQILAEVRRRSVGRLLLLGGEAGVGKTALLRSFCAGLPKPVRVLWGNCEPLLTPRPLGPFLDVAEQTGGELAELLTVPARPHEVASGVLRELAGDVPTVVVLEDVHWADDATLDVMTLLATRLSAVSALVLASFRDDELDRAEQLRFVLGELVRGPGRLRLEALSRAAVGELAAERSIDAEALYRRTAGNPFYVAEVLASEGEEIPDTVRDAVLARSARLSSAARLLLEVVAVVPGTVELGLLEDLAGELFGELDECLACGMLNVRADQLAFRHELSRLAVEEAIKPGRRRDLHRAALAALSARDADPARLAHHAEAAGDSEAVLRFAPVAAQRALSAGAHREAAAQYARALRFTGDLPPVTHAELLTRYAEECYVIARFADALAAQRQALDLYHSAGEKLGEGDALRRLSRLMFFASRTDEGEALAARAVEVLEGQPPGHDLAMAYANISQRRMVVEDADGALEWGARAEGLAALLGDSEVTVYALTNIGGAKTKNDGSQGAPTLQRALTLAQREGLEEYAGRIFNQLAMWPVRQRSFALAAEQLRTGLEYCSERGLDMWRLYLLALRARMELDLGHWEDAVETTAAVLGDPRTTPVPRGWALAVLAVIRARRGEDGVREPLDEADSIVGSTGEVDRTGGVAAARAEAAWLAGDCDGVRDATEAALLLALSVSSSWVAGELAYWRWQAGIREELPAGALAEPFRVVISGQAGAAAELWQRLGCPYEASLALAESEEARDIRQAMQQLQRLGAVPAAAIAARRLRERGVRGVPRGPRPRTRENPAGLTARELEVLRLLCTGLRNAQIAAQLVVSERTVDHHVSAVLRKLDAETRGEAAAAAARLGIHTEPAERQGG
jgi:DNA-binding CsgD family transcriptional regulator/tetratricopeptide (TPR) repeat protein